MTINKSVFRIRVKIESLLQIHRSKISYGKNTLWLLSERVARILSGIFVTAYLARYLGPENWGVLSYSVFLVNVFGALAFTTFGLDALVVKYILSTDSELSDVLGSAAFLKLLGATLQVILVSCSVVVLQEDSIVVFCVAFIAAGVMFAPLSIITQLYIARVEARYPSIVQLATTVMMSALRLLLIHTNAGLVVFALTFLIEQIVCGIGLILLYRVKFGSILNWGINRLLTRKMLSISLPFVGSGLLNGVLLKGDLFAIRHLVGMRDLGIYSVAAGIFMLWQFVPITICSSVFPAIVNAHLRDSKEFNRRVVLLLRLMIVLGLLVGGVNTGLARFVIPLLYGPSYAFAIDILEVLAWASVFFFVYVAGWRWLLLENLELLALRMMVVIVLVQWVLLLIGINRWGVIGAAYAMLGAHAFAGFLAFAIWSHTRPFFSMILCAMVPAFLSRRLAQFRL